MIKTNVHPGGEIDTLALVSRPLTPRQRAEEADLVRRCVERVHVAGDPDETAYTRALLRSMLLGGRHA